MKIVFDFGYTLYSVSKLYSVTERAFERMGVDKGLFQRSFQESKRKGKTYNPEEQFKLIVQRKSELSVNEMERKINEILDNSSVFLYPEVISFLEKFRNKFDLYILSYGGIKSDFQKRKIKKAGIEKYFRGVYVANKIDKISLLKKVLDSSDRAVFIDDNPEILSGAKKVFPEIITVRINRGEGKYKDYPNDSRIDFSVKNLEELEKMVLTELQIKS